MMNDEKLLIDNVKFDHSLILVSDWFFFLSEIKLSSFYWISNIYTF